MLMNFPGSPTIAMRAYVRSSARYLSHLLRYAVKERRADAHQLAVIASSSHFDVAYYLRQHHDVASAGIDPVIHFMDFGAREKRNPSLMFDTTSYVNTNPTIAEAGINPLVHFLRKGARNDRSPLLSGPAPAQATQQKKAHVAEKPPRIVAEKPPHKATRKADAVGSEVRKLSVVLDYLKSLDNKALVTAMQRIDAAVLVPRTKEHFKAKAWEELKRLSAVFLNATPDRQRLLITLGRGSLYSGDAENASHILALVTRLFPDNVEAHLYSGVAHMRTGHLDLAIPHLRTALRLDPGSLNIKRELATALRRSMRLSKNESERHASAQEAASLLVEVFHAQPTPAAALSAARPLYELKRYDECHNLLSKVIQVTAPFVDHMVLNSKALIGLNRIREALEVSEQVLRLEPGNQAASFQIRTLRFLNGVEKAEAQTFGDVVTGTGNAIAYRSVQEHKFTHVTGADRAADFEQAISQVPFTWIRLLSDTTAHVVPSEIASKLEAAADARAGFLMQDGLRFWRLEALLDLIRSGLTDSDLSNLGTFESIYARPSRPVPQGATAIVMSRNGSFKFGGGEHFIESMAEHYRTLGYDPIILGTRPDFKGQSGEVNGFRFNFVDDSPATLRRFFLENNVHLVHAISGLGFRVAQALNFTNISYIYGIHYWREALGHHDDDERFFDEIGAPIPRPEFQYILSQATTVYANSAFTRNVIEKAFGVRCPIVFSVPKDLGLPQ